MTSVSRVVLSATAALTCLLGGVAQAQIGTPSPFAELIRHVPETANAAVLVDADALFASPIAKRENWQADRAKKFAAGTTTIPPHASKLVIAANMDVDVMRTNWEVSIAAMKPQPTMSSLAEQFGGSLDNIHSVPAVRLPDDCFVLQFSDDLLGAMAPGNRQQISYWVNRLNRGLSPYLTETIASMESKAEVMMVMDLLHAFSADDVMRGIDRFESIEKAEAGKAEVAKLIASVKGVTLGIAFRDKVYGDLIIDFGGDASIISGIAKPLTIEMLGAYGVMVDEVADWKAEVKGNRISLTGPLTDDGLTRLNTLIHLPTTALHVQPGSVASPQGAVDQPVSANRSDQSQQATPFDVTKKYYDTIDMYVKSLKRKKHDMQTMGQLAQWFDNYGNKVDQLPTLHVDPEMLQYGAYISQQLHNASMALKGIGIQQAVSEVGAADSAKIYGGTLGNVSQNNWQSGGGYYGGGGGANYGRRVETNAAYGAARHFGVQGAVRSQVRQGQQAMTQVRFQSRAQAASAVMEIFANIETAETQVRNSMTDKYQVQF